MEFTYRPKGVCASEFNFDIEDGIIQSLNVTKGCAGNSVGIARLLKGRQIDEVIEILEGTICGPRETSCPDQISKALREYKESL